MALYSSVKRQDAERRTLLVALITSLAVMLVHELVDFCLHIPANALIFVLLLALAVRMGGTSRSENAGDIRSRPFCIRSL